MLIAHTQSIIGLVKPINLLLFIYRGVYAAAENYATQADQPFITLVEAFRNLQVEAEEPLENGDRDDEVSSFESYITLKMVRLNHLLSSKQFYSPQDSTFSCIFFLTLCR